ncbi:hypothetical protein LCGC14_2928670 [marine sediment metagenome]|uniref:Uncharacterized protein n=1 Tax=marine sediment metagenome TaxID=412755 RepID=A0A0F8XM03_9ZZZZ
MTVKELIKKLKKMPQNIEVGMAPFDETEWCAGDWVCHVDHIMKADIDTNTFVGPEEVAMFADMPDEYVVVHG